MKTAEDFAKEYYQLPDSQIESVKIKSAIRFAERYAEVSIQRGILLNDFLIWLSKEKMIVDMTVMSRKIIIDEFAKASLPLTPEQKIEGAKMLAATSEINQWAKKSKSVCPKCGSDDLGCDTEYNYCLNKKCLHVWTKKIK